MKLKKYRKSVLFFKKQILATAAAMDGILLEPMKNIDKAGCMMAASALQGGIRINGLTNEKSCGAMMEAFYWAKDIYHTSLDDEDGERTSAMIGAIFKNKKDRDHFELNKWDYLVIA